MKLKRFEQLNEASKVKKERIFFTVGDLKKLLENVPDNLPIGISGHFGEFHPMDEYYFRETTSHLIPENKWGWRDKEEVATPIFQITSPDIGPEPD